MSRDIPDRCVLLNVVLVEEHIKENADGAPNCGPPESPPLGRTQTRPPGPPGYQLSEAVRDDARNDPQDERCADANYSSPSGGVFGSDDLEAWEYSLDCRVVCPPTWPPDPIGCMTKS
jgi:hypothetical protein